MKDVRFFLPILCCCSAAPSSHVADGPPTDSGPFVVGGKAEGPAVDLPVDLATLASPETLATRFAALVWNEPPDTEVLEALRRARTREDFRNVARTMLADSRARKGVGAFFTWLLRLDDLATQPKPDSTILTPGLRQSMRGEAPAFASYVVLEAKGTYDTLLLAPYTFANETLARLYGNSTVVGNDFQKMSYETDERVGLLGEASVMTRFAGASSPTWPPRRFWLAAEVLFCEVPALIATPVPGVLGSDPPVDIPVRQALATITHPMNCAVCHELLEINSVGFAFMKLDTFGRYSPNGPGGPFDTKGTLRQLSEEFDGQPDFVRKAVRHPEVRRCLISRWLRYALDPTAAGMIVGPAATGLQPNVDLATAEFERSGSLLLSILPAIVATPAFLETK
jgi:hypothetical protein